MGGGMSVALGVEGDPQAAIRIRTRESKVTLVKFVVVVWDCRSFGIYTLERLIALPG